MLKVSFLILVFLTLTNESISSNKTPESITTTLPEYLYHSYEGFGYGSCGKDKIGMIVKNKKKEIRLFDHENKNKSLLRSYYTYDSIISKRLSNKPVNITINLDNQDSVFVLRKEFVNVKYKLSYDVVKCNPNDWDGEDDGSIFVMNDIVQVEGGSNTTNSNFEDSIKSRRIKGFFPIPFIELGSLSTVTKDSLIKHIMNTTSYYYDEYRNKYIGDGYIGSTGFIYHVSEGMKVWFPHSILSYDIVKTHNGEYLESKPMYNNKVGDYGFDLFNCNTTIFGSRICDINTRVSYQRKIDNNKYFYPNTKTNYYENRIEYKLLDNRLSDITLHFEGFTNPNDGIVKNKLTEYNNDSMVNEFFKDLDSLFGSSKILKTRFRDEVIRIWNYNNNRISVRYFNLNGRKQLSKISFTDWKYTTDFYQDIKKINPTVQVQLIFPSIYINEIK